MANILTYGTFDLLHVGHINILRRAAALGNKVFVGISTDEFNFWKGKKAHHHEDIRRASVHNLPVVSKTFWETKMDQKIEDIHRFDIDTLVMGDDWVGTFDYLSDYCKVVYFPRTPGISSTMLRNQLELQQ